MPLDDTSLDTLFRQARSHYHWTGAQITDETLHALYDTAKWGPTSANGSPARFVFLRTQAAKERLVPALSAGNVEKTLTAACVVIVAYDPKFYDKLPELFPHVDARAWFAGDRALSEETAFRNGTLQGAYMIMAARALGLDTGAMSGFDRAVVDEEFFTESGWRSNFLLNLGVADTSQQMPRQPRLSFEDACLML